MSRHNEYDRLCATKKGRQQCLDAVRTIADKHGATIELHEFNGPREIGLELICGPYQCMMHFDGSEKIGAYLGHWHTSSRSDATYPDEFCVVGSINQFHRQKATTIKYTLTDFVGALDKGLTFLTA
ncbi:hypothetical protein [Bradyrhizobium sp. Tv2a-2]|uniref:hypothetical protein n=1 Tax=Bradyrhizobium sp. Tv2a-2 TaxID=113395 RepID=UPI000406114D|nr:hypothetical protein [Bradyrhizobium sp. Tv2a-2]